MDKSQSFVSAYIFLSVLFATILLVSSNVSGCEDSNKETLDLKLKLRKSGPSTWIPSFTAEKYFKNDTEQIEIDLEHTVQKCGQHDLHRLTASLREDNNINETNEVYFEEGVNNGYICTRRVGVSKTGGKLKMRKNGTYTTVVALNPLKPNEMFEANLDWEDGLWYFVVGLTNQSTTDILDPHWLDYDRPGTYTWYGFVAYQDFAHVFHEKLPQFYFTRKQRFGLMIKNDGNLHFYEEDIDAGPRNSIQSLNN
ncbi:hypothetical protein J437_LFUL012648 [Ladona fulva]|uniref:Uncharacterized protein n=1 Tax=Ladona fulva TaxID=123851 RepID=A0A8K0KEQ1_LADFU|nr:hypothetical protein J437_LFUL012648 [Ladona fulva]